jgi:bacteriocin-like protein
MNEQSITQQIVSAALTEDDLAQIVGGDGDPNDLVGTVNGIVDPDLKATPILF